MEESTVLSRSYQEEFIDSETGDRAYDLVMIHQKNGYVIVSITALEEDSKISITNFYERIATQIYFKYLEEIKINNIIWVERIIHQISEETFFEVDLVWDEKSKFFHSPQWHPCDPKIIESIKTLCEECVD